MPLNKRLVLVVAQAFQPIIYSGWDILWEESDEEDSHCDEKVDKFAEEVVPRFRDNQFKSHFRMDPSTFENLLQKLTSVVPTYNVLKRGYPPVKIEKQAMITLWCLSNIESFRSVAQRFGISKSTCWAVLYRVCKNLLVVDNRYAIISWPTGARAESIIRANESINGFPGVIGSIDGSHIRILPPKIHANSYCNRKKYHSVLLQGVCDNRKLFLDIYVGEAGSVHDARLFQKSPLKEDMDERLVTFPNNSHLLGDLAYPLSTQLMVGFKNMGHLNEQQINYNNKLAEVRVAIENAFALLKGRFRRLKFMETIRLDLICLLVTAACILHNICILNGDNPDEIVDLQQEVEEEREANIVLNAADDRHDNNAMQKRNNIVNRLYLQESYRE